MDPLLTILKHLLDQKVEFVVIGGIAAVAHGASAVTQDVDVCIPFTLENCAKLMDALSDFHPLFRMRPDKMKMYDEPARLASRKNLYVMPIWVSSIFLAKFPGSGTTQPLWPIPSLPSLPKASLSNVESGRTDRIKTRGGAI
jgi:hypothetical protein